MPGCPMSQGVGEAGWKQIRWTDGQPPEDELMTMSRGYWRSTHGVVSFGLPPSLEWPF